jgi:hypothetical protein
MRNAHWKKNLLFRGNNFNANALQCYFNAHCLSLVWSYRSRRIANILMPVTAKQAEWRDLQSCTKMQMQSCSTHRRHAAIISQTVRYVTIKFTATKWHRNV